MTKIKLPRKSKERYYKNQGCQEKIKQMYNKNRGCQEKQLKIDSYKKLRLFRKKFKIVITKHKVV